MERPAWNTDVTLRIFVCSALVRVRHNVPVVASAPSRKSDAMHHQCTISAPSIRRNVNQTSCTIKNHISQLQRETARQCSALHCIARTLHSRRPCRTSTCVRMHQTHHSFNNSKCFSKGLTITKSVSMYSPPWWWMAAARITSDAAAAYLWNAVIKPSILSLCQH